MSKPNAYPNLRPEIPDVRTYLQFRDYLSDYFEWRQGQDGGFSFQKWADELGVKSRSFLRMVLIGQRSLSDSMLPVFAKGLGLNETQEKYFSTLVRFNQAKTPVQRDRLGQELLKLVRAQRRTDVQNHFAFLSSQVTPRLHTLLTFSDIDRSAENLARLLKVSLRQVQESLETLAGLNLIAKDANGDWQATSEQFSVPTNLGDVALQGFHRRSLEEAITAIAEPAESRRYASLLVGLNAEELAACQGDIMNFFEQLLTKYGGSRGEGRRLYQLNQNLVPVSEVLANPTTEAQVVDAELTGKDFE